MSLMRWDPFGGLSRMRDEIDHMLEDFFTGRPAMARVGEGLRIPSVDVEETDGAVVVRAELPGVKKENLDIEVTPDALVIKAQAREEKEKRERHFYRRERSWGMFQRVVPMPVEVKAKEAKATFNDGLLEVTLPKIEAEKKPEAVKVKPE
jgi:HSP20 family protein